MLDSERTTLDRRRIPMKKIATTATVTRVCSNGIKVLMTGGGSAR
jgi:hypothetical protein